MKSFKQTPEELEELLDFLEEDIENVRRVREFCEEENLEVRFEVHAKAETVDESARHSPVEKDQIIKTLIFKVGENFVAVMAPGDRRVDEEKLEKLTGEEVRMAKPEEVADTTGYVIGGVSPFDLDIPVYMEEALLEHEEVRPAAGSRVIGVEVEPEELAEAVQAVALNVSG